MYTNSTVISEVDTFPPPSSTTFPVFPTHPTTSSSTFSTPSTPSTLFSITPSTFSTPSTPSTLFSIPPSTFSSPSAPSTLFSIPPSTFSTPSAPSTLFSIPSTFSTPTPSTLFSIPPSTFPASSTLFPPLSIPPPISPPLYPDNNNDSTTSSPTNVSVLDGIYVKTSSGYDILVSDLWANKRVVLAVFRRFGCMMCREAALRLSALKMRFDEMDIRLVGIGFEPKEVQDFLLYWNGELYFDEPRSVYEALGVDRLTKAEAFGRFFDKRVVDAYFRVQRVGVKSNLKGDLLQPGATLVIGPSPHGILFEHRQTFFGDIANDDDILKACVKPNIVFGVYPSQIAANICIVLIGVINGTVNN